MLLRGRFIHRVPEFGKVPHFVFHFDFTTLQSSLFCIELRIQVVANVCIHNTSVCMLMKFFNLFNEKVERLY